MKYSIRVLNKIIFFRLESNQLAQGNWETWFSGNGVSADRTKRVQVANGLPGSGVEREGVCIFIKKEL